MYLVFYDTCGYALDATNDTFFDFLVGVAADNAGGVESSVDADGFFTQVVGWLTQHKRARVLRSNDMQLDDFVAQCSKQQVQVDRVAGGYVLEHGTQSVFLSDAQPMLAAYDQVAACIQLNLLPAYAGMHLAIFLEKGMHSLPCTHNLLPLLRRLALV